MQNKCFNCQYWFTCKKADPNIKDCEYFKGMEIKNDISSKR